MGGGIIVRVVVLDGGRGDIFVRCGGSGRMWSNFYHNHP